MAKVASFPVENGNIRSTLNTLWRTLLEKELIEGLLVPLELPNRSRRWLPSRTS